MFRATGCASPLTGLAFRGAVCEPWMHAVAGMDPDCLVWLLYLADNPREVTVNKSSDLQSQRGRVERYASGLGVEGFDAKNGYTTLCNSAVQVGQRIGRILKDDKSSDTIKFTDPEGRELFSKLRSSTPFRHLIEDALDLGGGDDTWFPFEVPEDAPIQMTGRDPEDDDGFTRFTVTASLTCARCSETFAHEYTAIAPREQFVEIQAACPACGYENTHHKINPNTPPW